MSARISPAPAVPAPTTATAREIAVGEEVERRLRTRPAPDSPVRWRAAGSVSLVSSQVRLTRLVAALRLEGTFGCADLTALPEIWRQTMRVPGGCIVEVNGVPGPDCFARRLHREGDPEDELFVTADQAAAALRAWLRGSLPHGMVLRQLSDG